MERIKNIFNTATVMALLFLLAGLLAVFYLNHTSRRIMVNQAIYSARQEMNHQMHQLQYVAIREDSASNIQTIGTGDEPFYLAQIDSLDKAVFAQYPWLKAAQRLSAAGLLAENQIVIDSVGYWSFARMNGPPKENGRKAHYLIARSFKQPITLFDQQLRNQLAMSVISIVLLSLLLGLIWYYGVTRKARRLLTLVDKQQTPSVSKEMFNELDRLHDVIINHQQHVDAQRDSLNHTAENLRKINRHLENDLHAKEKDFNLLQSKLSQEMKKRAQYEGELHKLQHIIAHSPLSIVITDTKGQIEYVNPRFTQVTGYTFEESIGQNPRILKSGESPPEVYKHLWDTISSGSTWEGEFHNKKKSGELYWEYAYISPVKNGDGKITHYFALKEDITEQKKLNENLKMFAQALTHIGEIVTITDMDDRFIYVNKAFMQQYGYTAEEVLGKHVSILLPKDEYSGIPEDLHRLSHTSSWYGELKNISKDGKKFDVLLSTSIIYNEKNQPVGIIGVSRDITNEKKDRELERKTEALKTIQELAGAVSHEFSQPLQALDNYLSLMEMVNEPKKYIQKSRVSLQRISELVNNLRDITSIQRQDYLDTQILNLKASSHTTFESKKNRILIVDDEEAIQETLVELLEMAGYQCDGAADGLAALNLLRENDYGLILSDINMPKMSGAALFDKLQSIGYNGRFIFMTGYAHSKENEEYMSKGDGILHKPIDALRLLDIVQKSIGAAAE